MVLVDERGQSDAPTNILPEKKKTSTVSPGASWGTAPSSPRARQYCSRLHHVYLWFFSQRLCAIVLLSLRNHLAWQKAKNSFLCCPFDKKVVLNTGLEVT